MLNIHCRFVTYSTPETGVVPEGGGGGQFSPFRLYHPPPPSLRSSSTLSQGDSLLARCLLL